MLNTLWRPLKSINCASENCSKIFEPVCLESIESLKGVTSASHYHSTLFGWALFRWCLCTNIWTSSDLQAMWCIKLHSISSMSHPYPGLVLLKKSYWLLVTYACRSPSDTIEECASMSLGGTFSSLQIFPLFSLTSLGKTANRLIALFGRDGGPHLQSLNFENASVFWLS